MNRYLGSNAHWRNWLPLYRIAKCRIAARSKDQAAYGLWERGAEVRCSSPLVQELAAPSIRLRALEGGLGLHVIGRLSGTNAVELWMPRRYPNSRSNFPGVVCHSAWLGLEGARIKASASVATLSNPTSTMGWLASAGTASLWTNFGLGTKISQRMYYHLSFTCSSEIKT